MSLMGWQAACGTLCGGKPWGSEQRPLAALRDLLGGWGWGLAEDTPGTLLPSLWLVGWH